MDFVGVPNRSLLLNESAFACGDASDENDSEYVNPLHNTGLKILFILLYSVVFVFAFVGNALIITVVLKHRRMRTITNFFLANLAVADLAVGIFCVLPNLSVNLSPHWVLGRVMCKVYYFVQAMSYTASITILTVISIERYVAIIYPLRAKQLTTMCLLRVTVILIWVLSAASGVPYLIIYDQVNIPVESCHGGPPRYIHFCMQVHNLNLKAYITSNFVIWFCVPLVLMTVLYVNISIVLWKSSTQGNIEQRALAKRKGKGSRSRPPQDQHNYVSIGQKPDSKKCYTNDAVNHDWRDKDNCLLDNINEVQDEEESDWPSAKSKKKDGKNRLSPVSARASVNATRNGHVSALVSRNKKPEHALLARRKVIRLLIAVLLSFTLCVLPYHVRVLWQTWSDPRLSYWQLLLPPITFVIFYLNSGLNPILYAFLSEKFRQSLIEVITCREYKQTRCSNFSMKTLASTA